jgi:hypothetical protein
LISTVRKRASRKLPSRYYSSSELIYVKKRAKWRREERWFWVRGEESGYNGRFT